MHAMPKGRLTELDFLRAISTVAVVLIHVTAGPLAEGVRASTIVYMLVNQAARFSIAAFVFITAVALFYRYDASAPFHTVVFLKKRVSTILLPYLLWSSLYTAVVLRTGGSISLALFATSLLLGNSCYHLYFIVLIFQYYLLFPLFRRVHRLAVGREKWLLGVSFVLYMLLMAHNRYGSFTSSTALVQALYNLRDRNFIYWLFYFVLGAMAAPHWNELLLWLKCKQRLIVAAWALTLGIAVWEAYFGLSRGQHPGAVVQPLRPMLLLYTLTAIGFTLLAAPHIRQIKLLGCAMDTIAENSFAIYLAHPAVLMAMGLLTRFLHMPHILHLIISTLAAIVVPIVSAKLLHKVAPVQAPYVVGQG